MMSCPNVLDLLRRPLEDGEVTIVRASGAVTFPARFSLVGAMNPCPCGYLGDPQRECTCPATAVQRYKGRLSGPLLDRFDLRVEVAAVRYREMTGAQGEEPSASIRARVERARRLQTARYAEDLCVHTNAQMGPRQLKNYCTLERDEATVMGRAMDRMGFSAPRIHARAQGSAHDRRSGGCGTDCKSALSRNAGSARRLG